MLLNFTVVFHTTGLVKRETAFLAEPLVDHQAALSVALDRLVSAPLAVILALVHLATDRVLVFT